MIRTLQTCKNIVSIGPRCSFFHWVNLQFNVVNEDRVRLLGADRTCAEWILRNGGKVKWVHGEEYVTDYNNLPKEEIPVKLQEIDATGSCIMTNGFEHLKGCKYIDKIILHECHYLENAALKELCYVKDSLMFLQVSKCGNVTEAGLKYLLNLEKLRTLVIFDLPYVEEREKMLDILKKNMKQCSITFADDRVK
ncbi:ATP synthase subunit s, mitochondrial [Euwallacea fornicatus]|uniref:ATP synthase subunit s, mitochondrial n=1 Tax=Euwallacea fornicatus TaxID=995702 RepID=UPI00338DB915